jgi:hypothetical protein
MRKGMRRLVGDTTGAVMVVFALALPAVVGGFGLGTEAGMWYFNQRKLQNAADIAAFAAAAEVRAGRSNAVAEASALEAARRTGFDEAIGNIVVTTPFGGDPNRVEVRVREQVPRRFSGLFLDGEVDLGGRAVARISEGVQTCVLALDPTAPRAVTFSGNTETIFVSCNVHSNSLAEDALYIQGSPDVTVDCLSASGRVALADERLLNLTGCVAPYERADQVPDPYAGLPLPTMSELSGPCRSVTGSVLTPGRYCSGIQLNSSMHFEPGLYVLEGDFRINAQATVTGNGVTFYMRNSNELRFNGGADIRFSGPDLGDPRYPGILFFGDRTANTGTTHTINGNASSFFHGAVYAPSAHVRFLGNNDQSGGCSQIVSRIVTFTGNSSVGIDCTAVTVQDIRSARLIQLVE